MIIHVNSIDMPVHCSSYGYTQHSLYVFNYSHTFPIFSALLLSGAVTLDLPGGR